MKFAKSSWSKTKRERTPRRMVAARKAVQREKDSVALFPELAKYKTPEERLTLVEDDHQRWTKQMRDHAAKNWREARRRLRWMAPEDRRAVIAWWNNDFHPLDPVYLLDHIRHYKAEPWTFFG